MAEKKVYMCEGCGLITTEDKLVTTEITRDRCPNCGLMALNIDITIDVEDNR